MEPLERLEHAVGVVRWEADPVVRHGHQALAVFGASFDHDARGRLASILQGVGYVILHGLAEQGRVADDGRHLVGHDHLGSARLDLGR